MRDRRGWQRVRAAVRPAPRRGARGRSGLLPSPAVSCSPRPAATIARMLREVGGRRMGGMRLRPATPRRSWWCAGALPAVGAAIGVGAAYAGMQLVAPRLGGTIVALVWRSEAALALLPLVVLRARGGDSPPPARVPQAPGGGGGRTVDPGAGGVGDADTGAAAEGPLCHTTTALGSQPRASSRRHPASCISAGRKTAYNRDLCRVSTECGLLTRGCRSSERSSAGSSTVNPVVARVEANRG